MYINKLFAKGIKNGYNYKTFFSTIDNSTGTFFKKNLHRLKKKTNKYRFKKKKTYSFFIKNRLTMKKVLPKLKFGSTKLMGIYRPTNLKKSIKSTKHIRIVKHKYGVRSNWLLSSFRKKYTIGSFYIRKKINKQVNLYQRRSFKIKIPKATSNKLILYQQSLPKALSRLSREHLITSYSKFLKPRKRRRAKIKSLPKDKKFNRQIRRIKTKRSKKINRRPNRRLRRGRKLTFQNILHIRRARSLGGYYPVLSPKPFRFKS